MGQERNDTARGDFDRSQVEEEFEETRETIGREELGEVMDSFQEKVEQIKQSSGPRFVRRAIGHAKLFYKLLEAWWTDRRNVPWKTITAIGAVLLYFINPFDIVPDMIPVVGLMDDATMIYIGFSMVQEDLIDFARDRGLDLKSFGIDPEEPRPPVTQ
jgi:uncharacterized membrane protein YkvA (DUF1232 family)